MDRITPEAGTLLAQQMLNNLPVMPAREQAGLILEVISHTLRVIGGETREPPKVDPTILALRHGVDRLRKAIPEQARGDVAGVVPPSRAPDDMDLMVPRLLAEAQQVWKEHYAAEMLTPEVRGQVAQALQKIVGVLRMSGAVIPGTPASAVLQSIGARHAIEAAAATWLDLAYIPWGDPAGRAEVFTFTMDGIIQAMQSAYVAGVGHGNAAGAAGTGAS